MNRHIININGKTFVFYLKGKRLDVFMYKNGPQKVDFTTFKNPNQTKELLTKGIIEMFKREMIINIKNKRYSSLESLEKDFLEKISSIENPEVKDILKNIKSNKDYTDAMKELTTTLQNEIDNVEEKKELIEKKLDIDLKELFERNGITEYEISPSKKSTLIVYKGKSGIPHTIINNNPNMSIYDVVVKNLQFDYANTENIEKEIDKQAQNIIETEGKHTYTENETVDGKNIEGYLEEIKDYILKNRSDIKKVYGIKPSNNALDSALILESDKGFEPIIVTRENNGNLKINFPNKKQVNKDETTTNLKQDAKKDTTEKYLNKISNESEIDNIITKLNENKFIKEEEKDNLKTKLSNIYSKINADDKLTDEDNKIISLITETDLYNKIIYQIPEIKDVCDEIIKSQDNVQIKEQETNKVKKIEPPKDKNAFIELTLVTFLSGLISGLFVYSFFKTFIK